MPHFRTTIDPPAISITSAALGPDVWPSLKMARAALDDAVDVAIAESQKRSREKVAAIKVAAVAERDALRAARAAALKVPQAKLASEPAAPAEAA